MPIHEKPVIPPQSADYPPFFMLPQDIHNGPFYEREYFDPMVETTIQLDPNMPRLALFDQKNRSIWSYTARPLPDDIREAIIEKSRSLLTPLPSGMQLAPRKKELLLAQAGGMTIGAFARSHGLHLHTGLTMAQETFEELGASNSMSALYKMLSLGKLVIEAPPPLPRRSEAEPPRPNEWLHMYLGAIGMQAAEVTELFKPYTTISPGNVARYRTNGLKHLGVKGMPRAISYLFWRNIWQPSSSIAT